MYISKQKLLDLFEDEPEVWTEDEYELGSRNQWRYDKSIIESCPTEEVLPLNTILDIIHEEIYKFFDICGDDEEVPVSEKDKLLLDVNKAITAAVKLHLAKDQVPS